VRRIRSRKSVFLPMRSCDEPDRFITVRLKRAFQSALPAWERISLVPDLTIVYFNPRFPRGERQYG
jgi:hypothetical protein